ncbi:MAG: hypothetical protein ACYDAJ_11455 [Nitrosotalea sp.]
MANARGGIQASVPSNAYGSDVTFNVSPAVATIAQNLNAWANAGAIVDFIVNVSTYVECALTYAYNIGGLARGWYFAIEYISNGSVVGQTNIPISDPTGHSIKMYIFNDNGTWKARYDDQTIGFSGQPYVIPGSPPNTTVYTGRYSLYNLESAPSNCSSWSSLTGSSAVAFSNVKYLNSSLGEMSYTPTLAQIPSSDMPTCSVGGPCLNESIVGQSCTVSYRGC